MTFLELHRRHKTCQVCGVKYCDITKRFVGITCSSECAVKCMVIKRQKAGSYARTSEQNEKVSIMLKKRYDSGERKPTVNAMLAVSWTPERLAKREKTCKDHFGQAHWAQTAVGKQRISEVHTGKTISLEQRKAVSEASKKRLQSENQYSRCRKGKRADLGDIFFRSTWEANYARILNHLGIRWEYEPETFQVGEVETYTPDFKLMDGTFVEIKGWWTETSKRKIELFKTKYPDIKLEIITRAEYKILSKQYCHNINHWE
jgi:Phage endonuclease I